MEVSLAICILAALLATGTCLQCEVCNGPGNNCTGSMQTCAAGEDSCGIFLIEIIQVGMKIQNILQGCAASTQCKAGPVSMNFGNGMTTRTSVACCVGDTCRPAPITVPPADTKPNGRRCPACYALSSEQCREETINCTGSETHCIDTAGFITIGAIPMQTVIKGCASESICAQIKVGSGTFAGISADLTTAKCTAASGEMGVPPATTTSHATGAAPATTTSRAAGVAPGPARLLLPALAGLLLLKLLS
ncbi:phospholipase A2 inhibitor subunit gamma B-like [Terrapene carolina triunguis]|uniref:phospholipase A2 inhibitor subunit gamma B-like n=1 Tax=Terrapene triunguis TaxID=2587831 RepID=UPI000E77DCC8|nr:phospholipase A2 inhibitor subunit gamma B-like [Terrapene carolina triunguis]